MDTILSAESMSECLNLIQDVDEGGPVVTYVGYYPITDTKQLKDWLIERDTVVEEFVARADDMSEEAQSWFVEALHNFSEASNFSKDSFTDFVSDPDTQVTAALMLIEPLAKEVDSIVDFSLMQAIQEKEPFLKNYEEVWVKSFWIQYFTAMRTKVDKSLWEE